MAGSAGGGVPGGVGGVGGPGQPGATGQGTGVAAGIGAGSAAAAALDARNRRNKVREESEGIPSEGGGENISTAAVSLKAERYRPRIYGFQVHEIAKLQRWQEAIRDRQVTKLETWETQGVL